MSKNTSKRRMRARRRRYIFHDNIDPTTKVYLVYYYNTENVIMMTDGPFNDETVACEKMRDLLVKGYCAWMVSYNG
jgi:hypothetical protein